MGRNGAASILDRRRVELRRVNPRAAQSRQIAELHLRQCRDLRALPYAAKFGFQECRWHPTDPQAMFFAGSREVGLWNVVTNDGRVIAKFDEPLQTFGPWSGNVSDDAKWAVVSCAKH
ncbi:MAG: hypothetical protein IPM07_25595 [Anaerolineales bacterium]|nr:hypothetical protein [Anaerolineales bacterium]